MLWGFIASAGGLIANIGFLCVLSPLLHLLLDFPYDVSYLLCQALELGYWLRQQYIDLHGFLPPAYKPGGDAHAV